jgi:hypothetical protein
MSHGVKQKVYEIIVIELSNELSDVLNSGNVKHIKGVHEYDKYMMYAICKYFNKHTNLYNGYVLMNIDVQRECMCFRKKLSLLN